MASAKSRVGFLQAIPGLGEWLFEEYSADVSATVQIPLPDALLLRSKDRESLEERSRLFLALKFYELGELSSGQAAEMCGLSRVAFLFEAGKHGVPVVELSPEELTEELA